MRPARPHGHDRGPVPPPAGSSPAALHRRTSRRPRAEADPNVFYTVADFLHDQERLIPDADPQAHQPHVVELPDGRMLVVHTRLLREVVDEKGEPADVFSERYGCGDDASHLSRFRLVLDFLDDWREEISSCGLGCEGEPMEVREELVDFLLRYSVDPDHPEIPRCALTRLLDELSTRWT